MTPRYEQESDPRFWWGDPENRRAPRIAPWGVAMLDAPSLAAWPELHLRSLRRQLVARFGVKRFLFLAEGVSLEERRTSVYRSGWEWVDCTIEHRSTREAVAKAVATRTDRLVQLLERGGLQTLVLATHDERHSDAALRFLEAGGDVVLVGYIEWCSRDLYALWEHPRCELLDVRHDLDASRVPFPP